MEVNGKTRGKKINQVVEELAQEVVEGSDLEVVDVEYKPSKGRSQVIVYIDKPGGITIEDCEEVSKSLGDLLDIEDPIKSAYVLEVSSPGVERVLKKEDDYRRFVGHYVRIKTFAKIEGRKNFAGLLQDFTGGIIQLQTEEGDIYKINIKDIAGANLWFK